MDIDFLMTARPIRLATSEFQRRTHHKRRINKKWRKRYGIVETNMMPHGMVITTEDGALYMTKRTFEEIYKERKV